MEENELLERYGREGDEAAFAELVRRNGEWVYCAARRELADEHLAEDVSQAVFALLAKRAKRLAGHPKLGGWLFGALRYCAREAKRQMVRQRRREQEVARMRPEVAEQASEWEQIAPVLEASVAALGKADREVVLLRFYQQKAMAEVGEALGVSEEAAKKRVQRAVGKLREKLCGKGVEVEAGSLGAMVLAHAVEGGPAGLVEKVMAGIGGGAGNGTAGVIAKGAEKMMVMAKVKMAAVAIAAALVAVAAVGTAEIVAHSGDRIAATAAPSKGVGLATTQAVAVESPITVWKRGDADRAVDLLRKTDWSAPGVVPVGSTFAMSEATFVQMPQKERDRLQPEVQADARELSALLRRAMAKGDEMAGKQDNSAAQSYYRGVDRCARYFAEDGRSLKIHQLVATAFAKAVKLKLPQAKE